jgi:hypothetical protein
MTQANALVASAAVIALTLGVTGKTTAPRDEPPLSTSDIVIAAEDSGPTMGQSEDSAEESAKMGKEEGTQSGENEGDVPESQSQEAPPD